MVLCSVVVRPPNRYMYMTSWADNPRVFSRSMTCLLVGFLLLNTLKSMQTTCYVLNKYIMKDLNVSNVVFYT